MSISLGSAAAPTLMPPPISLSKSLPPTASTSGTASSVNLPPSAFTALPPSALKHVLSDPSALVLDIRPHNAYVQARIPNALSLSVPSTLLKRPLFSLSRLADMLPTTSAREKFSKWPEASRILVYDADSASIPQHTQSNNLLGLMRKFRSEGFPPDREVAWLRGGFHSIWRDYPQLVDHEPPSEEAEEEEESQTESVAGSPAVPMKTMSAPGTARVLRAQQLPKSAFTSATTIPLRPRAMPPPSTVPMQIVPPTPAMSGKDPFAKVSAVPPTPAADTLGSLPPPQRAGKPQFALRLPPGLMRPKTATPMVPRGPLYSMPTLSPQYTHSGAYGRNSSFSVPGRQVAFNPFFDTIRQNIELGSRDSKGKEGEGIPLKLPRRVRRRVGELPFEWLRQIARKSRRVTESSSADDSDDTSGSDGDSGEEGPRSLSVNLPTTTKAETSPKPLRFDVAARRSPPKSRSSSPAQPIPIPSSSRCRADPTASIPSSPTPSSHSQSPSDADDLTRTLENQFYRIELGEQKRLLGVMERHSMESGSVIQEGSGVRGVIGTVPPAKSAEGKPLVDATVSERDPKTAASVGEEALASFPYSITAGLEKGAKNRYRNIWPFEHARVRLRKTKPDDDDYMNASYVQPLGTTRRYIATQGPLPATFADFWTLCWEQNVHVIVMLTREIEGSSVKCGKYWEEGLYGTLRLRLLETNDTPERERKRRESEIGGGFFSSHVPTTQTKTKGKAKKGQGQGAEDDANTSTIKRVFELTNSAYPSAPPRIVTQYQYLEWPDLNVPDDPRGVLDLMRQVEETVEQTRDSGGKQWGEGPLYRRTRGKMPSPERSAGQHGNTVVIGQDRSIDEVDSTTGVSVVAKENAPVLLHCSAGVGRTGGFIAVDAVLDGVRREMRKRKASQVEETATAKAASSFGQGRSGTVSARSGSQSRSRSRSASVVSQTPEPMDVDSSPSPSPNLRSREMPALTAPVAAGDREVHIPIAGYADSVPMDVDERQEGVSGDVQIVQPAAVSAPKRADVPPPLMQASPELVDEVRRATLRAWPTMSPTTPSASVVPSSTPLSLPRDTAMSESSSEFSAARTSSRSVPRSRSRSSASPPTSQTDSSTSAMVGKTARLTMASPSPPTRETPLPQAEKDPRIRTASTSSASSRMAGRALEPQGAPASPSRPSMASQSLRLNSWRSEVHSSDISRAPDVPSPTPSAKPSQTSSTESTKTTSEETAKAGPPSPDLKEPRRLHDDTSPPLLSTYDEPIRRVIEDMREQRMSLCQSLRQYVFVHRAIIEGALMIVDEEKRQEAEGSLDVVEEKEQEQEQDVREAGLDPLQDGTQFGAGQQKAPVPPPVEPSQSAAQDVSLGPAYGTGFGSPFIRSDGEREVSRKRSFSESLAGNTIVEGMVSPSGAGSSGRPKRGGSPAELTKEDVDGGVLLTKRPSVKRRQRPSDVGGQRPTFDSILASSSDAR